ncbi:HDOD domain-containing protein [Spirochaeta isovalerica]|uniref:HD-like signal output (HDOD) protein n=1 Tax=Spirochaeta isovalerica TaxID=150 RepID=A0A841R8Q0_9SPIO|nr:HDOD domain-containing protein [Spirochaeta isovalerica]MBB6478852.1 HD-like signal output (HDOD) protein [Spirochaeta isovalerica]
MDQLILYTLQFYKMEVWFDYFSLLTRGLLHFAMDSCKLEQCNIRFVKKERSFGIQIFSDVLKNIINKREFIEFINDLYDEMPKQEYYSDIQFLKKLFEIKQIEADNITYSAEKLELDIPDCKLSEENWNEIREAVIDSIEELPPLKENLLKLEEMLHSGSFDMNAIARQVGTDPALTMDILKIVNSGAYMLSTRIEDIQSALKYLGLRELYNLLITLAIRNVLSDTDRNLDDFWFNSYKSAFYACHIAHGLDVKIAHTDSIYTAALLHDIGKFPITMIFENENEDLIQYCSRYKVFLSDIEDALSGIRHCETGYLMAEKWNLPDSLKFVMRFHHEPDAAPEAIRNLNDVVYLADTLVSLENMELLTEDVNQSVLKRHRISSTEDFIERFSHLKDLFENAKESTF